MDGRGGEVWYDDDAEYRITTLIKVVDGLCGHDVCVC